MVQTFSLPSTLCLSPSLSERSPDREEEEYWESDVKLVGGALEKKPCPLFMCVSVPSSPSNLYSRKCMLSKTEHSREGSTN